MSDTSEPAESAPADMLAERIRALPDEPGVYLFKDGRGKVLYVGKAKSLRDRVRSYLGAGPDSLPKNRALMGRAPTSGARRTLSLPAPASRVTVSQ